MAQLRDGLRRLTTLDWVVIALGFVCAFFLAFAGTFDSATVLRIIALIAGVAALALLGFLIWQRRDTATHGQDWTAFEAALPRGVVLDVPDGMSYAAELPQLLDELESMGEPPYDGTPGRATNAIFGELDRIHYCTFQYHHGGAVDTVGFVALRPDRDADVVPDVWVEVTSAQAMSFTDRYRVSAYDDAFVRELLSSDVRSDLLAAAPFNWSLIGNQILTFRPGPATPAEAFAFIDERLTLLASIADRLPTSAGIGAEPSNGVTAGVSRPSPASDSIFDAHQRSSA